MVSVNNDKENKGEYAQLCKQIAGIQTLKKENY